MIEHSRLVYLIEPLQIVVYDMILNTNVQTLGSSRKCSKDVFPPLVGVPLRSLTAMVEYMGDDEMVRSLTYTHLWCRRAFPVAHTALSLHTASISTDDPKNNGSGSSLYCSR